MAPSHLTPSQQEAVVSDQNLAIVAAPGSGKTLVLIEKVAFLVQERKIPLSKILFLTFADKTAQEIRSRLQRRLSLPDRTIEETTIGTVHSFLGSLLPRSFQIIDDSLAQLQRIRSARATLVRLIGEEHAEAQEFVSHFGFHPAIRIGTKLLSETIPHSKNYPLLIESLKKDYNRLKQEKNWFDFLDLEEKGLAVVEQSLPSLRSRFSWILIDEFQDTSPIQWKLLNLLQDSQNRLVIVGDPRQSIYRFRGAHPELFWQGIKKIESNGGQTIYLDENFRSQPSVVQWINELSPKIFPDFPRPLVATQKQEAGCGVSPLFLPPSPDLETGRRQEGEEVAKKILQLREQGEPLQEIALLFRTRRAIPYFEEALQSLQIPFLSAGGELLLEQPEILLVNFLLQKTVFPGEPLPPIGLEKTPLESLKLTPADSNLKEWLSQTFSQILPLFPEKFQANLREFQRWLEKWTDLEKTDLKGLLETIRILREEEARILCPSESKSEAVHLLTVHGAKGLEFQTIFLCDLFARSASSPLSYLIDSEEGLLFPTEDLSARGLKRKLAKSTLFEKREEEEKNADREESKRLLYVAVTRAKKRLFLPLSLSEKKESSSNTNWGQIVRGMFEGEGGSKEFSK